MVYNETNLSFSCDCGNKDYFFTNNFCLDHKVRISDEAKIPFENQLTERLRVTLHIIF